MSWFDLLPSSERHSLRKRMRSPEVYEKTREGVKGPEALKKEMEKNAKIAEIKFAIETNPEMYDKLKKSIDALIEEQGIENVLEINFIPKESISSILEGKYIIRIETDNSEITENIVLLPEGNVKEKVSMQKSVSETFIQEIIQK